MYVQVNDIYLFDTIIPAPKSIILLNSYIAQMNEKRMVLLILFCLHLLIISF